MNFAIEREQKPLQVDYAEPERSQALEERLKVNFASVHAASVGFPPLFAGTKSGKQAAWPGVAGSLSALASAAADSAIPGLRSRFFKKDIFEKSGPSLRSVYIPV